MKYSETFKSTQEIAYKTIYNSFNSGKKSHVYLISGDKTSPLKEVSLFLAKCFLCNEDVLCCEECKTCSRVDNGSYSDIRMINEDGKGIVKDDILSLQEEFSLTPLEGDYKVYIINNIEDGGEGIMNKLLKFIEEPQDNIYGIITTNNISKVLPTIISRCQLIKLIDIDSNIIKDELISNGYDANNAFLVSRFTNSLEDAKNILDSKNFESIKDLAFDSATMILENNSDLIYYVQTNVYKLIDKNDKNIELYLELLNALLMDYLINKKELFNNTKVIVDKPYIEKVIAKIMLSINKLEYKLNPAFILDKLLYEIKD